MLDILIERIRQKKRTVGYPSSAPALPARFRGRPFIDADRCPAAASANACGKCVSVCPSGAVAIGEEGIALDMGLCTFCGNCARVCPHEALVFTTDWRLASTEREALVIRPSAYTSPSEDDPNVGLVSQSVPGGQTRRFLLPELPVNVCEGAGGAFARSFRLRQVSAAGCGACEADLNVLSTIVFDISRFGMDFVASPRHADGLVLTGPVPRNMREALLKCHAAMASPKPVIAVGACAISGGLFRTAKGEEAGQRADGATPHVNVDLYIPGCPPHPYTSLDGMLRFIGRKVYAPQAG